MFLSRDWTTVWTGSSASITLVTEKMADLSLYVVGVFLVLVVRFSDKDLVIGLNNGLALTPPSKSYLLNSRFEHEFELICSLA